MALHPNLFNQTHLITYSNISSVLFDIKHGNFQRWWQQIPVLLDPRGYRDHRMDSRASRLHHHRQVLRRGKNQSMLTWNHSPPFLAFKIELYIFVVSQVWPAGSLEEYVQNLVKTWEMELVHKANPDQYKSFDHKKCVLGVNGTCISLLFSCYKNGFVVVDSLIPSVARIDLCFV